MKKLKIFLKEEKIHSLMFVFAHPDDESFLTSGLVQVASELNIKTHLVCLTKGEKGKNRFPDKDIKKLRTNELKEAVKVLSINKLTHLGYADAGLDKQKTKWGKDLKYIIKKEKPDMIVTFDLSGITGHPDHIISAYKTYEIVKSLKRDIKLFWRTPSNYGIQKFSDVKSLKYRSKANHMVSLSFKQLVIRLKAIFTHQSQIQGVKHLLEILRFALNREEPYYKVDLSKGYEYVLFPYKID